MSDVPQPDFVQPRKPVDGSIILAEPDAAWAEEYAHQEARIRAVLGPRVLQVEHVGSTSVPGLAAKPILDILLVVGQPADENGYVPDLEAAGYVLHLREPAWHEHRLLRRETPAVNLHVFATDCPEVERMLLFRDHLRSRTEELALYQDTKRELAASRWAYVQDYADAKSAVVEAILTRARADPPHTLHGFREWLTMSEPPPAALQQEMGREMSQASITTTDGPYVMAKVVVPVVTRFFLA